MVDRHELRAEGMDIVQHLPRGQSVIRLNCFPRRSFRTATTRYGHKQAKYRPQ